MRRWDVDPDRHSPDTRPEDTYDVVYEDDRSDFILSGLLHWEAEHIAAAHNAEVDSLPSRDEIAGAICDSWRRDNPTHSEPTDWRPEADVVLALLRGDTDG